MLNKIILLLKIMKKKEILFCELSANERCSSRDVFDNTVSLLLFKFNL